MPTTIGLATSRAHEFRPPPTAIQISVGMTAGSTTTNRRVGASSNVEATPLRRTFTIVAPKGTQLAQRPPLTTA